MITLATNNKDVIGFASYLKNQTTAVGNFTNISSNSKNVNIEAYVLCIRNNK